MMTLKRMTAALLSVLICVAMPLGAMGEHQNLRGSILAVNGEVLAYSNAETGERVYPYGDALDRILGTMAEDRIGPGRGMGGVEEAMDYWLDLSDADYSIYLTLDMDLQQAAQDTLDDLIAQSSARDVKGSLVVMDMFGRVLAMANADKATDGAAYNYAISQRSAPGELFLMVPGLKAFDLRYLVDVEILSDEGYFTMYDRINPPRCWIDLNKIHRHANLTLPQALEVCCYYYFFTAGARLGSYGEHMQSFAKEIGLFGETGIELPGESESFIASQRTLYTPGAGQYTRIPAYVFQEISALVANYTLAHGIPNTTEELHDTVDLICRVVYDHYPGEDYSTWKEHIAAPLRALGFSAEQANDPALLEPVIEQLDRIWYNGTDMLQTVIGQSISQVTPIAIARYFAAIANGGYVYHATIIDGVMLEDAWLKRFDEPAYIRELSETVRDTLPLVREGLHGVVDIKPSLSVPYLSNWEYLVQVGAMKGYGKDPETNEVNSIWFAGFAPFEHPEIVVVVNLVDGKVAEDDLATAGAKVFEYYLDRQAVR